MTVFFQRHIVAILSIMALVICLQFCIICGISNDMRSKIGSLEFESNNSSVQSLILTSAKEDGEQNSTILDMQMKISQLESKIKTLEELDRRNQNTSNEQ